MKVKSESEVAQSCLTLRDPMDCSLPGSSVHGIFQARVLEWGAIAFSDKNNDVPITSLPNSSQAQGSDENTALAPGLRRVEVGGVTKCGTSGATVLLGPGGLPDPISLPGWNPQLPTVLSDAGQEGHGGWPGVTTSLCSFFS